MIRMCSKDAQTWLDQSGIEFDELAVINSVDPISRPISRAILARLTCWRAWRKGSRAHTRLRTFTLTWSASMEFAETHGIRQLGRGNRHRQDLALSGCGEEG